MPLSAALAPEMRAALSEYDPKAAARRGAGLNTDKEEVELRPQWAEPVDD